MQPLEGINHAALDSFKVNGLNGAVAKEYLEAKAESTEPHFGTIGDVDSSQLDQAGWAVMFAPGVDQKIREALQPLLDRRKDQVGDENLFKIFEGETGYQPEDTASDWLRRKSRSRRNSSSWIAPAIKTRSNASFASIRRSSRRRARL